MAVAVPPVRVIVADELGQLKAAQAPDLARLDELRVVSRWGSVDRARSAECMAVGSAEGLLDTATAALAVGRVDGSVEILNPYTGTLRWRVAGNPAGGAGAAICGVHFLYTGPAAACAASVPLVLSCTRGGAVRLHAADPDGNDAPLEQRAWAAAADACCTACDPECGLLAVGCRGTELRLYDAATAQASFVAKGGRPNAVGLPDRAWNSALAFLPGCGATRVAVGTGHHKLRLYDTRAGKRPQVDAKFGEARLTALAPEADGLRCWVADGSGRLEAYDWRAARFCGAVKGIAGSVRSLALHPDRPVIASAGLDRFLRLHDTATRRPLGKIYLKTQLTGVAFCPADAAMVPPPEAGGDALQEAAGGGRGVGGRRSGSGDGGGSAAQKRRGEAGGAAAPGQPGGGKKQRSRREGRS